MIYGKSGKFWLGRLRDYPDIMTQGRTLKELEDNVRDAHQMMVLDDVPDDYELKEITCSGKSRSCPPRNGGLAADEAQSQSSALNSSATGNRKPGSTCSPSRKAPAPMIRRSVSEWQISTNCSSG